MKSAETLAGVHTHTHTHTHTGDLENNKRIDIIKKDSNIKTVLILDTG